MRNELKRFQKILTPLRSDVLESRHLDDEERRSSEAVLKITLDFLRRMKQDELSTLLQSSMFHLKSSDMQRTTPLGPGPCGPWLSICGPEF